jgi:hypothetical protein
MIDLKIPDPFETFVLKKYKNVKGSKYDFFSGEWYHECGACKESLYAPTKKEIVKTRLYHSRNLCLGGY